MTNEKMNPMPYRAADAAAMFAAAGTAEPLGPDMAAPMITPDDVARGTELLRRYKDGKRALEARIIADEQWYRLRHWQYLRDRRREQGADTSSVSAATIEAIRASMDGVRTKENQQLGSRLSSLSNAIAGGPYIGLLGTVLGIMVVFLGTAMAGDVNINAIAPGMAAALLATAMGLFVAIPALFGYNRLVTRNKEVSADMRVFVDEFVTRLAEVHGESQLSEVAHRRNGQPLPA